MRSTAIIDGPLVGDWLSPMLVASTGHGGISSFVGIVRDHSRGRAVSWLDYECHRPMAREQLARFAEEAAQRFDPALAVAIAHGVGRISPGQASVAIHAASAHRVAAFDASRWLIEAIKRDLVVWKREVHTDGISEWVKGS